MTAAAKIEPPREERAALREKHVAGDAQIDWLLRLPETFAERVDDLAFTPPQLAAIRAQTLIVSGDRDPFHPVERALELHRAIEGSALYVIPGGGHAPIYGESRADHERVARAFLD
jgi:pimeloyl-ACP methyl ester carboxylesterase